MAAVCGVFQLLPMLCLVLQVHCEEVCYGELGCFSNDPPYDKLPGFPPDPPDQVNVRFFLYTRLNRDLEMEINWKDPESLNTSPFDAQLKTIIYIHGWSNVGYNSPFAQSLRNALLDLENMNVFIVDWTGGSDAEYKKSAQNTRITGREVAYLIQLLHHQSGMSYENVYCMGSSLGAHTCGFVGANQPGLGRISAFDPAGPFFSGQDPTLRLDPTDANYVDVIHTDNRLGMMQSVGHADFYPNGGKKQPGCQKNGLFSTNACSHKRAHLLFLDSLYQDNDCELVSYPCTSWDHFQAGSCSDCGGADCPVMGYYAESSGAEGLLFLETGSSSPYCVSDEE